MIEPCNLAQPVESFLVAFFLVIEVIERLQGLGHRRIEIVCGEQLEPRAGQILRIGREIGEHHPNRVTIGARSNHAEKLLARPGPIVFGAQDLGAQEVGVGLDGIFGERGAESLLGVVDLPVLDESLREIELLFRIGRVLLRVFARGLERRSVVVWHELPGVTRETRLPESAEPSVELGGRDAQRPLDHVFGALALAP